MRIVYDVIFDTEQIILWIYTCKWVNQFSRFISYNVYNLCIVYKIYFVRIVCDKKDTNIS